MPCPAKVFALPCEGFRGAGAAVRLLGGLHGPRTGLLLPASRTLSVPETHATALPDKKRTHRDGKRIGQH